MVNRKHQMSLPALPIQPLAVILFVIILCLVSIHFCLISAAEAAAPQQKQRQLPARFESVETSAKWVALTFDDGPDPVHTPALLKLLHQENVKATFFVLGSQVVKHPQLAKQIVNEGHLIANHSWTHRRFTRLNPTQLRNELRQTNKMIHKITGVSNSWFRPPYGAITNEQLRLTRKLGFQAVLWSVDTRDWSGASTSQICNTVHKQLRPGGIILMHTIEGTTMKQKHTVEATAQLIRAYKKRGYRFVTVDQMTRAPQ